MRDPYFRIATICPAGMSDALKNYLSKPASESSGANITMRDVIAGRILEPFEESNLPFACTFLGWASEEYEPDVLCKALSLLNDLTISDGQQKISSESLSHNLKNGTVQIVGAYPLLDLADELRTSEYEQVSLLNNKKQSDTLFSWCFETLLADALETDEFGVVCAVLSESDSLAEEKIYEMASLLEKGFSG